jgi:hypothetical protein
MNYRLIEKDGKKYWVKLIYDYETNTIEQKLVEGKLELDPNDFYRGDEVMVTTNPPPDPATAIPLEELLKTLRSLKPNKKFEPCVYYCTDSPGQALEVYLESDAHLGKWISPYLTLFYSVTNQERLIGFRVDNLISLKTKCEGNE